MYLNTAFDGTIVGVGAALDFSAVLPIVPGASSTAGTVPGPEPEPEPSAEGRLKGRPDRWVECDERSGVVEIRDPRLFRPGREAFCRAMARSAITRFRARRVEVCLTTATCRLQFKPGEFDRTELGRRVAEAVSAAIPSGRDRTGATPDPRPGWTMMSACAKGTGITIRERPENHPGRVARPGNDSTAASQPSETSEDASRLGDLAKAGGSLAMAVAGAILPGIPTLPFLLLAARHGVRVSPALDRFLRRWPWTAALLDKAESSEGLLKLDARSLLKLIPMIGLIAAVLLIFHPPLPVVLALEIALMAFLSFRELGWLDGGEIVLGAVVSVIGRPSIDR